MREVALVAVGGAVGATLRYLVGVGFAARGFTGFPWHTILVNVVGAFLLGVLAAVSLERGLVDTQWVLLLGTGVLGGFTTFSAMSHETVVLIEGGYISLAALYAIGGGFAGVAAAWLGLLVGRAA